MPTLLQLFKHVKEQDDDPFMLEVIRAVIRERINMPLCGVWWILEAHRLDETYRKWSASQLVTVLKSTKIERFESSYVNRALRYTSGYRLEYTMLVKDSNGYSEYDYDQIIIDQETAELWTSEYLKEREESYPENRLNGLIEELF